MQCLNARLNGYGFATGDAVGLGDAVASLTNGSFNAFKSELLITKVPSRPSTCAHHMPSSVWLPTVSVEESLLSGPYMKVRVSCGLSKPCRGAVVPSQRTACKFAKALISDCTLA